MKTPSLSLPLPPYNHTRGDSPRTPCLDCLADEQLLPHVVMLVEVEIPAAFVERLRSIYASYNAVAEQNGTLPLHLDDFVRRAILVYLSTVESSRS